MVPIVAMAVTGPRFNGLRIVPIVPRYAWFGSERMVPMVPTYGSDPTAIGDSSVPNVPMSGMFGNGLGNVTWTGLRMVPSVPAATATCRRDDASVVRKWGKG